MKFRLPFEYDVQAASDEAVVTHDYGPSLTVQSMTEDVDLNVIMRRFGITGKMPDNFRMPEPHEFGEVPELSFRQAQDYVVRAREAFDTLPADVRARFANRPGDLLEFLGNEANRPEAERLGLVMAKPAVVPPAVAVPEVKPPA